jgi:hypothetical protein
VINSEEPTVNLCMTCHQGRTSKFTVDEATEGIEADTVAEDLRFQNIHYFAAGATLYGTEAKGAYEYDGKEYLGRFDHVNAADTCVECHGAHELEVQVEVCVDCHDGADAEGGLQTIRESEDDFDGDGDATEGIAMEIDTMRQALYAAIQDYAANQGGAPIIYDQVNHPYFFIDTNGNGEADPDEAIGDNRYATWTPRLLRAAYNYQYSTKDPGAFAHNGLYILQVLYDSLEDLGADVGNLTRP